MNVKVSNFTSVTSNNNILILMVVTSFSLKFQNAFANFDTNTNNILEFSPQNIALKIPDF